MKTPKHIHKATLNGHNLFVYIYYVYSYIMYIIHILCIFKEQKVFNFAVSEVGMGDMRGARGRRHGRGQGEEWDGENVVTFLLK